MELTLDEIRMLLEAMGFELDYDQASEKGWARFQLKEELDEPSLRLIWYINDPDEETFHKAADILFRAGQKEQMLKMNKFTSL